MPLEVVSTDGRTFRYREYVLPALAPNDVRVRVEFAAPKHGTELHSLTGSPQHRKQSGHFAIGNTSCRRLLPMTCACGWSSRRRSMGPNCTR